MALELFQPFLLRKLEEQLKETQVAKDELVAQQQELHEMMIRFANLRLFVFQEVNLSFYGIQEKFSTRCEKVLTLLLIPRLEESKTMEAEERARLEEEINSKRSEVRYSRRRCCSFSNFSSPG